MFRGLLKFPESDDTNDAVVSFIKWDLSTQVRFGNDFT